MEFEIKLGEESVKEITVTEDMSAKRIGSGSVDVFSTPSLISLMENVSQILLQKFLSEGYSSVGININVNHIKASKIGARVTCKASISEVNGKKVSFNVEAYDEKGKIGEGTHKRYIINMKEFINRL
ncbi:MAG: thioesterase family protein [Bacillota bacterium]|nr:thioesterase family protein [Bacillota bacterium]